MLLLLMVHRSTTIAVTLKLVLAVPAPAIEAETLRIIAGAAVRRAGEAGALRGARCLWVLTRKSIGRRTRYLRCGAMGAGLEHQTPGWEFSDFVRLDNLRNRANVGCVMVDESNSWYFEPAPGRTAHVMFNAWRRAYWRVDAAKIHSPLHNSCPPGASSRVDTFRVSIGTYLQVRSKEHEERSRG